MSFETVMIGFLKEGAKSALLRSDQWFSKCGLLVGNLSITWELVRSTIPRWHHRPTESKNLEVRRASLFQQA